MKSKKAQYILIPLVLIIWALIGKQIYQAANNGEDDVPVAPVNIKKEAFNDYTIPKDTTRLLLNYRDPFGLVRQKDTAEIPVSKLIHHEKIKVITPAVNWSFIQYAGYMRNAGSKRLIAMIRINGTSKMLSEGESAEGVKLIKNFQDSIRISYNGQTKCISINRPTL